MNICEAAGCIREVNLSEPTFGTYSNDPDVFLWIGNRLL